MICKNLYKFKEPKESSFFAWFVNTDYKLKHQLDNDID